MIEFIKTTLLILYIISSPILAAGVATLLDLPQNIFLFIILTIFILLIPIYSKLFLHKKRV